MVVDFGASPPALVGSQADRERAVEP
jgi:hypothetical protein